MNKITLKELEDFLKIDLSPYIECKFFEGSILNILKLEHETFLRNCKEAGLDPKTGDYIKKVDLNQRFTC